MDRNLKKSIINLRIDDVSVKEIANILNCSVSTVSYHINNNNLGGVRANKKEQTTPNNNSSFLKIIGDDNIKFIVDNKKDGATYKQIHSLCDVSYDNIKRVCRIFKVNKNYKRKLDAGIVKKIKTTYQETNSIRKTAKQLKISREVIRQYVTIQPKKDSSTRKKDSVNAVKKHRKKIKERLVEYKGGKCVICGYCKNIVALTFHHIDPQEKEFGIGGRNYSWERMVKEVDKCSLLCHNCHAELHDGILNK